MTYQWTPVDSGAEGRDLLSPIADFRLRHVQASQGPGDNRWWSVLIDLHQSSLDALQKRVDDIGLGDHLRIPQVYTAQDRRIETDSYLATIFVTEDLLDLLNRRENDFGLSALYDGLILSPDSLAQDPKPPDTAPIEVCRDTAIMAVIDDGIAIAHDLFRTAPDDSRVHYAAILGAVAEEGSSTDIGRVLSKQDIDELLKDCLRDGILDEQAFYQRSGQIDFYNQKFSPVSLRRSHGTHVAALAAGYRMRAQETKRPMLCVSLPPRVTEDTSGQSMLPAVGLALQCLAVQSRRYVVENSSVPAPVVVNFSFGNFAGPHDGTGVFAQLFEQFQTDGPNHARRAVVLPVGNGNLSQTHASQDIKALQSDGPVELNVTALPDDRTATHVQFWMPYLGDRPPHPVWIDISAPGETDTARLALHTAEAGDWSLRNAAGQEVVRLSWAVKPAPTQRAYATLSLAPTASLTAKTPIAPAGRWQIKLSAKPGAAGADEPHLKGFSVQCWVRRDETLPGFQPGGRQATFEDRHYRKHNKFGAPLAVDPKHSKAKVERKGTISGFATGVSTIVVGAVTAKGAGISDYSASGPVTWNPNAETDPSQPPRVGPDAMARGDDSPILNGVLSAGSSSGSCVRMSGSSVAAPRIARAVAGLMLRHDHFDRAGFVEWVAGLDGPRLKGPRYRGGELPSVPVSVDFWEIPNTALEPPLTG